MRYPQILTTLRPKLADITRWNKDDGAFLGQMLADYDAGTLKLNDADLVRLKDMHRRYVVEA